MKTEQIEKIIADQKNAAKKLATALLAAATITTGAAALSSCDETPSVQGSEITSSQTTNEIPSETITETVTEEVTYEDKEEELLTLITKDFPEFETGIWGYNIILNNPGFNDRYYTIHPICYDENKQDNGRTFIDRIVISEEMVERIKQETGAHYHEYGKGNGIIMSSELPEDIKNYLTSLCYELYSDHFENSTNLEQ